MIFSYISIKLRNNYLKWCCGANLLRLLTEYYQCYFPTFSFFNQFPYFLATFTNYGNQCDSLLHTHTYFRVIFSYFRNTYFRVISFISACANLNIFLRLMRVMLIIAGMSQSEVIRNFLNTPVAYTQLGVLCKLYFTLYVYLFTLTVLISLSVFFIQTSVLRKG